MKKIINAILILMLFLPSFVSINCAEEAKKPVAKKQPQKVVEKKKEKPKEDPEFEVDHDKKLIYYFGRSKKTGGKINFVPDKETEKKKEEE